MPSSPSNSILPGAFYEVEPSPYELSDAQQRVYRKQLMYEGDFVKRQHGKKPIKFRVDGPQLERWQQTFNDMMHEGISVPMPLGHTEDPEKCRGVVIGMEVDKDDKGRRALYALTKFRDQESEKLALTSDISIYVPPDFTSGTGKTYKWPIRHVALTNYPVIPGLAPFQELACSLSLAGDLSLTCDMCAECVRSGKDHCDCDEDEEEETESLEDMALALSTETGVMSFVEIDRLIRRT